MVLFIPTDIARRFVEEFVHKHALYVCMAFEVCVAFGKFFHQFMEGRPCTENPFWLRFGVPLLDTTIVFINSSLTDLLT